MISLHYLKKIHFLLVAILIFNVITLETISVSAVDKGTFEQCSIKIDGNYVKYNSVTGYPFIDSNNRTLVPLRQTVESFGCSVGWDGNSKIATISKENNKVIVYVGWNMINVSGATREIDTNPVIVNNRVYLPIRAVLEAFGYIVYWNQNTKTVVADIINNDWLNKSTIEISDDNISLLKNDSKSVNCKLTLETYNYFGENTDIWLGGYDNNLIDVSWGNKYKNNDGRITYSIIIKSKDQIGETDINVNCSNKSNYNIGKEEKIHISVSDSANAINDNLNFNIDNSVELVEYQSLISKITNLTSDGGKFEVSVLNNSVVNAEVINKNLKITAKKQGTTTIVVYYTKGNKTVNKTIKINVTKWNPYYTKTFTPQEVNLGSYQTVGVSSGYRGESGQTCIASSSDLSVATVLIDSQSQYNGSDSFRFLVYGHKIGKADITFKFYVNNSYIGSSTYTYTVVSRNNTIVGDIGSVKDPVSSSNKVITGQTPIYYTTSDYVMPERALYPLFLYSADGKDYLGKLVTSEYAADGIWNKYSKYGNSYNTISIWNTYGKYGSSYSNASAFNKYATNPPVIIDSAGKFVGYLTSNQYKANSYSINELVTILNKKFQ